MKKLLPIALFASVSLFSFACAADWQSTTWGMTIEDAYRLYPKAVPQFSGKIFGRLMASERIDGFDFNIWLAFSHGGLVYVEMELQPASDCDKLRQWAAQKYGKPATTKDLFDRVDDIWLWQGEVIRLTYERKTADQAETCTLDYAKAPAPRQ